MTNRITIYRIIGYIFFQLAPIAVIIAAASARQIYTTQSLEGYSNSAELYQSALEHQQRGLYSGQSGEHATYEVANHRPEGEKHAQILAYHSENDGHHYAYAYETENGNCFILAVLRYIFYRLVSLF